MPRITHLLYLIFALLPGISISGTLDLAQGQGGDGWTLQQTCAPAPLEAPAGFNFPGVIVSRVPDDGVRGLRAETMRTYYIAFAGSNFIESGALSPDGSLFAVPYGYIQTAASSDVRYIVQELRVISTEALPQIRGRVIWQASFQVGQMPPIRWLDDETFLFPQGSFLGEQTVVRVNPLTDAIEQNGLGAFTYLAPDNQRGFQAQGDTWGFYNLTSGDLLARFPVLPDQLTLFRWIPDSSRLVAVQEAAPPVRTLVIFDREGSRLETIIDLTTERLPWNFAWSPDGTKFVFSAYDPYKNENTLYIGDLTTRTLTDTCVLLIPRHDGAREAGREAGVVWSPDSTQLALITSAALDDPNAVQIMDVVSGARYGIGVYAGGLLGWGAG